MQTPPALPSQKGLEERKQMFFGKDKHSKGHELVHGNGMAGIQTEEFTSLTQPITKESQACFYRKNAFTVAELNALQCASLKYLEVALGIYQCSVTKLLSLFFCGLGRSPPELAPSFAGDQPELKENRGISSIHNQMCGEYFCAPLVGYTLPFT